MEQNRVNTWIVIAFMLFISAVVLGIFVYRDVRQAALDRAQIERNEDGEWNVDEGDTDDAVIGSTEALEVVQAWAEAVKMRDGRKQYELMSPELKDEYYERFAESNWTTGVSSPWVESYRITERYRGGRNVYRYEVVTYFTDSTDLNYTTTEYVTVSKYQDSWLISSIERIEVKGKIDEVYYHEDKSVRGIFVRGRSDVKGYYDRANVIIDEKTKIYQGYTDKELKASDLKAGAEVEVAFADGMRTMIYPVTALAKVIRVK